MGESKLKFPDPHEVEKIPGTEHLAAGPVHDRHQVEKTPPHRDVGDIRAPDVTRLAYLHPAQQVRVSPVPRVRRGGVGLLVDGGNAHLAHKPHHPFPAHPVTLSPQPAGHLPGAIPWGLQKLSVYQAHEFQIQRTLALGLVVKRRPADTQKLTPSGDAQALGMAGFDLPLPPLALNDRRPWPKNPALWSADRSWRATP